MKNKKLTISICAIILVVAIFMITGKLNTLSPAEYKTRFFPHLEAQSVTSLVITDGESSITLSKAEDRWTVSKTLEEQTFPADNVSVQIAIEKIVSMKKGDLVSENPANQPTFEVDEVKSMSVQIFTSDNNTAADTLHIGKTGPDWGSNYVRLGGTNEVYLVPGGLRMSLFCDMERWRAKEEETSEEINNEEPDSEEAN